MAAAAAGGIPTDNRAIYRIDGGFLSGFALGAWVGISREYPEADLLGLVNDEGRQAFDDVADMTVAAVGWTSRCDGRTSVST